MKGFISNLTKILLLTFGALIFMGNGCGVTEQEKEKYRKEGYEKGKVEWYKKGKDYGKELGKATGQDEGLKEGKRVGYELGFKEGKEKGWRNGYLSGSVAFVGDTWIPTLGLVITILLGVLLFFILRSFFYEYGKRIRIFYDLKIKKSGLRYDIAKLVTATNTPEHNYKDTTVEALNQIKDELEDAKLKVIDLEIKKETQKGHIQAAQNLLECKKKLVEAQYLINEVALTINVENERKKIDLIKILLKGIEKDKFLPVETRVKLLDEIANSN